MGPFSSISEEHIRVSLVGGLDRLAPRYRATAEGMGFKLRVFNTLETNMPAKLASSAAIILFTSRVSHEARIQAVSAAKSRDIPLFQCHSCGICSLRDCLECIARAEAASA